MAGRFRWKTQKVAGNLIWKLVGLAHGVRIIIFMCIGGVAAFIQLRAIRGHLDNLDSYVSRFQSMAGKASDSKAHFQDSEDMVF